MNVGDPKPTCECKDVLPVWVLYQSEKYYKKYKIIITRLLYSDRSASVQGHDTNKVVKNGFNMLNLLSIPQS